MHYYYYSAYLLVPARTLIENLNHCCIVTLELYSLPLPLFTAATMTSVSSLVVIFVCRYPFQFFSMKAPQPQVFEASDITVAYGCKLLTVAIMETPF